MVQEPTAPGDAGAAGRPQGSALAIGTKAPKVANLMRIIDDGHGAVLAFGHAAEGGSFVDAHTKVWLPPLVFAQLVDFCAALKNKAAPPPEPKEAHTNAQEPI